MGDPAFDSGIYLIKGGKPVNEPGQMLLIKNDPKYNEQWPRALIPYKGFARKGTIKPLLQENSPSCKKTMGSGRSEKRTHVLKK